MPLNRNSLNTLLLTSVAMLAFAGNSILCRIALKDTHIDAASFTAIRVCSGAIMLLILIAASGKRQRLAGSWGAAFALFVYAACFSFSYVSLTAGTGALLLFGAVQATMIGFGLWRGERLLTVQWLGLSLALLGLLVLLMPGLSAPPLGAGLLMLLSGVAWGVYSIRGKGASDPGLMTCGNFVRAVPFALLLLLAGSSQLQWDYNGACLAVVSGSLASGLGYWLWYRVLPALQAATAATVQLSVPVITALLGVVVLAEPLSLRLMFSVLVILGGIALVVLKPGMARH